MDLSLAKQKLYNQAECLNTLHLEGYEQLKKLTSSVESGDKGNKEPVGAKYYFKSLFGDGFKRDNDN